MIILEYILNSNINNFCIGPVTSNTLPLTDDRGIVSKQ